MKRRHFILLIVYSLLVPLAASAASFAVALRTDAWPPMVVAMLLVTSAGMYLILRWWLGVARSVGISNEIAWTPSRVTVLMAYAATMVGSIGLGYLAYASTGKRFIEAVVAIGVSLPILLALYRRSRSLVPAPKPQEAATLRFRFYVQLLLPIVFTLNVSQQLVPPHETEGGFEGLRNWLIPMYFVLIPLFPINALFIRKRYLQALAALR